MPPPTAATPAPLEAELRLAIRTLAGEEQSDLLCALLQSTDYGILMTDHEGRDIVCNRRLGELFGLNPQRVVERPPESVRRLVLRRVADPRQFVRRLEEIYQQPDLVAEDEIRLKAPHRLILRRYTAPVANARGENVGRIWTFLDVTPTRQLQQRVEETAAALAVEVEQRTAALRATTGVLQTMEGILRAISRGGDRETLLCSIAVTARHLFGFHCAAVLLNEAESDALRGVVAPGRGSVRVLLLPSSEATMLQPSRATGAEGPTRLFLLSDPLPEPFVRVGCGSLVVVPLGIRGSAGGVLVLGSREVAVTLLRHTREQIEAVGKLVALAIETLHLHSEVQQAYRDLSAAQEQLVRSEKLSAAGTLATSIAHDLRNIMVPLRIELGMATGTDSEALAAARDHLDRLGVLTQRLLAFARPAALQRAPVRIGTVLEGVRSLLKSQAELEGVTFSIVDAAGDRAIIADRAQLEQLCVNLALNAFAAMSPEGGCLQVSCEVTDASLRVCFADTGHGIAEEDRERIFEPFYSTKHSGTGLGLVSCRRIVEDHGGRLEVASVQGEGSCFSIFLPLGEPTP
jgi:signal transduction histidine kinase